MLKVGLIGCGFMGSMHANCYLHFEGVKVTAIADVRPEKAEELAKLSGAEIYSSGMELIERADVDVIDICLPTYLHANHAIAAMDKVKYVFIEKPVALTKEEGRALINKAKETGAKVQVGQVVRFMGDYVELANMVKDKRYGKVVNARFSRLSPTPRWGFENWLLDPALSGGAGQDLHIHDIDYVLWTFGTPEKFYSAKNVLGTENDYVNTLLKYPEFVVSVEGTWSLPASYPFTPSFRVVFENATVEKIGDKLMLYTEDGAEEIKIEELDLSVDYKGGNVSALGSYFDELLYFTGCAKNGSDVERATLSDAVASLDFLLDELAFS